MPLSQEVQAMKIAPLGNFHDITNNLPDFYLNYLTIQKQDFERHIGFSVDKITNGSNFLVRNDPDDLFLFIDSESDVVMRLHDGKYIFHCIYRSSGNGAVKIDLKTRKQYSGLIPLCDVPAYCNKIRGVFSTQFSSCGLQLAFISGSVDAPRYIIISHLQNKSRLASIVQQLQIPQEHIYGIFSIMCPLVDACEEALYNLNNVQKRSVTLIRNNFLWPTNNGFLGFGMGLCGYLFNNTDIQFVMKPVYSTLFNSAIPLDISRMPIFNSTPVTMRNQINRSWAQTLSGAHQEIKEYYFNLFRDGLLGDKYFVNTYMPQNQPAISQIQKLFFTNFNWEGRRDFIANTPFQAFKFNSKFITWQRAFSPREIIDGIQNFNAPNINDIFRDMEIAPEYRTNQQLQRII